MPGEGLNPGRGARLSPGSSRIRRLLRFVPPLLVVAIFAAAIRMLQRELGAYALQDVLRAIARTSPAAALAALGLTAVAYVVFIGYDLLSLRYLGRTLPLRRVALAGFVGYAFSASLSFGGVTGASLRYRIYAAAGLGVAEIGTIVLLNTIAFWLGVAAVGGAAFAAAGVPLPTALPLPFATTRPLGLLLLALVAAWLAVIALRRGRPVRLFRRELPPVPLPLAVGHLAVGACDGAVAALVVYLLLPAGVPISFPSFLVFFLVANLAGLVSTVPGGLGVFETLMLGFLAPAVAPDAVLGALLAFRAIFYLLPLVAAAGLLAVHELARRTGRGAAR
jgi:uncharacterized membrane protein YbhN (UPF0104 family)